MGGKDNLIAQLAVMGKLIQKRTMVIEAIKFISPALGVSQLFWAPLKRT